jgi:hypothetical protein
LTTFSKYGAYFGSANLVTIERVPDFVAGADRSACPWLLLVEPPPPQAAVTSAAAATTAAALLRLYMRFISAPVRGKG